MHGGPGKAFENERLQAVYEARSLFVIAFVLANLLAMQLLRFGMETLATALVAVAALPLVIVLAGLLKTTGRWIDRRNPV